MGLISETEGSPRTLHTQRRRATLGYSPLVMMHANRRGQLPLLLELLLRAEAAEPPRGGKRQRQEHGARRRDELFACWRPVVTRSRYFPSLRLRTRWDRTSDQRLGLSFSGRRGWGRSTGKLVLARERRERCRSKFGARRSTRTASSSRTATAAGSGSAGRTSPSPTSSTRHSSRCASTTRNCTLSRDAIESVLVLSPRPARHGGDLGRKNPQVCRSDRHELPVELPPHAQFELRDGETSERRDR